MRLLNTSTLTFEEPLHPPEKYAILSHRWQGEEVSYEDYRLVQDVEEELLPAGYLKRATGIRARSGYRKIVEFCATAKRNGYDLAWIDTCCIDKRSSAELSEAINSMWSWYERASVCYVYLADVPPSAAGPMVVDAYFRASAWFTRGWTLQELLAPRKLLFYSQDWVVIGELTKVNKGTARSVKEWSKLNKRFKDKILYSKFLLLVAEITRIPAKHLLEGVRNVSIAQKMTWAAGRRTSREEDRAYSLLGLFGINMPLIYGEGSNAFLRLQKEIIQQSDDHSIFAWTLECEEKVRHLDQIYPGLHVHEQGGILATSPDNFCRSSRVHRLRLRHEYGIYDKPYSVTNKGIEITAPVLEVLDFGMFHIYVIALKCSMDEDVETRDEGPCLVAFMGSARKPPSDAIVAYWRVWTCDLGDRIREHYPSTKAGPDYDRVLPLPLPGTGKRGSSNESLSSTPEEEDSVGKLWQLRKFYIPFEANEVIIALLRIAWSESTCAGQVRSSRHGLGGLYS